MASRRSLRYFSAEPVDYNLVKTAIQAASTAPSGANKQPWAFCLVSNTELKKRIREMAEDEEYRSYNGRMSEQWLKDLVPFGTNHLKPFLETAPYLIVVFKQPYEIVDGERVPNYYVSESVGIAVGILLSALHLAGLSTLTHTPSPMNFLSELLDRPSNERPYLLIPVGYPSPEAKVPDISRKPICQVLTEY
jgi:nitroreductase